MKPEHLYEYIIAFLGSNDDLGWIDPTDPEKVGIAGHYNIMALAETITNDLPVAPRTNQIADLILSLAIHGGREGLVVTAEDRDGADYLDCQNAAHAIVALMQTPTR